MTREVRTLSILFSIYGWVGSVFSLFAAGFFALSLTGAFSLIPTITALSSGQNMETASASAGTSGISPIAAVTLVIIGIALLTPVLYVVIGSCLKRGKARWLAYVGAILALWNVPLGLALGIYTFVVLGKTENQQGFA